MRAWENIKSWRNFRTHRFPTHMACHAASLSRLFVPLSWSFKSCIPQSKSPISRLFPAFLTCYSVSARKRGIPAPLHFYHHPQTTRFTVFAADGAAAGFDARFHDGEAKPDAAGFTVAR